MEPICPDIHHVRNRQADEARFSKIYDEHYDKVYRYAYLLTQCAYQAEEIVQEVFIKVWIHRSKWDELECFDAWLYTVMRNRTLDYIKKLEGDKGLIKEAVYHRNYYSRITEEMVDGKEIRALHQAAVNTLTPQRRLVYVLTRVYGWSRQQVATALGVSPNTVRVQMGEALRGLRKQIRSFKNDPS